MQDSHPQKKYKYKNASSLNHFTLNKLGRTHYGNRLLKLRKGNIIDHNVKTNESKQKMVLSPVGENGKNGTPSANERPGWTSDDFDVKETTYKLAEIKRKRDGDILHTW